MKTLNFALLAFVSLCLAVGIACSSPAANVNNAGAAPGNANSADPSSTPVGGGAQAKLPAPEALIADLYKAHDGKKSPFFQTKDRALVDKYFTKPLADLIWKDATTSAGEVGAIDGDPLYNAQDVEIKNFAIGKGDVKGDTATVAVTFTNFGDKKTITFALKAAADTWKIDNIQYGDGDSLMKWLKETYPDKASTNTPVNGEFEGKYTIGETSCTVKPVKMAFEIRWAKGSGVEMFYADGEFTFTSHPDKGEPNTFVFDDQNYNSGTFNRGDGKTFTVKRAK